MAHALGGSRIAAAWGVCVTLTGAGLLAIVTAMSHAESETDGLAGTQSTQSKPETGPAKAAKDPLECPLVQDGDLEYVGAFSMPAKACGWTTAFTYGALTHRYVKDELRFLSTVHRNAGSLVYEVTFPGLSDAKPPVATVAVEWGDVYGGKRWVENEGGIANLDNRVITYGLHWSEERQRLYWNYGHWYNASSPSNPCIGFSTLDDATDKAVGVASYRLRNRPEKFGRGGALDIPAWFAKRYTSGKTLGVGFGGYFSATQSGSMGPALCAIQHPDTKTAKDRGAVEQIPLIGYPFTAKPGKAADRGHRNADYTTAFDGWVPRNNVGYWTWVDEIWGGGTWIDLPEKQGVLFFCAMGHGKVWYEKSDRHAERGKYWCLAYHPRDLADVAKGKKEQWQIQPRAAWPLTFGRDLGPDLGKWTGEPNQMVCGATFDRRTRRLYVLVRHVWRTEVEYYPRVYCWQVK
jgi:hypothetical protein